MYVCEGKNCSNPLTCYVQVERGRLRAQTVLPSGGHSVDPHSFVDVFDSVLNGAHIRVGQSMTVPKVQRDARPGAVSLCTRKTFSITAGLFYFLFFTFFNY